MAAQVEDGPTPAGAALPLNKICDRRDWEHPEWRKALGDLGYVADPARLHRKDWEFAQGLYGLRKLNCLSPDAAALGLGSGTEPIIFFLAGRLRSVVATDLYAGDFSEHEADPRMLRDPEAFAPFSYHRERLHVRRMDATAIDYEADSFDIVFSFSSFEHFGSRRAQRQCLAEVRRVLRPRGVLVLTTEMILNVWGRHGDYFRRTELLDDLLPESGLRLAGGAFDFTTSRATLVDGLVRLPHEVDRRPHLVLRRWRTYFTSCALFLEKPAPPGTPEARCAPRGEEPAVGLPPLLKARLSGVPAQATVPRSARYTLTCRVENVGHARWPCSSPDGFGLVRLGAHLAAPGGSTVQDYGRADLPRDLAPGASAVVTIELTAPDKSGQYRVELDMVREGVAWFSSREPAGIAVALAVT
jgi:SAM-dependent methyltransferase